MASYTDTHKYHVLIVLTAFQWSSIRLNQNPSAGICKPSDDPLLGGLSDTLSREARHASTTPHPLCSGLIQHALQGWAGLQRNLLSI